MFFKKKKNLKTHPPCISHFSPLYWLSLHRKRPCISRWPQCPPVVTADRPVAAKEIKKKKSHNIFFLMTHTINNKSVNLSLTIFVAKRTLFSLYLFTCTKQTWYIAYNNNRKKKKTSARTHKNSCLRYDKNKGGPRTVAFFANAKRINVFFLKKTRWCMTRSMQNVFHLRQLSMKLCGLFLWETDEESWL